MLCVYENVFLLLHTAGDVFLLLHTAGDVFLLLHTAGDGLNFINKLMFLCFGGLQAGSGFIVYE